MRHDSLWSSAVVALLLAAGVFLLSCDKDESTNPADAPELPPVSTLVMDFSDFQHAGAAMAPVFPSTRENWGWAALNVAVWNTILTVTLAVPVASFVEAFNHTPQPQSDGSWLWTYSFTAAGALHTARLYGRVDLGGTYWDMYISKSGEYTDFHWYSGESNLALTQGTWSLNHSPQTPTPFIDILWHRNPADTTGDLTYTNVIPGHADNGGYISYGITTGVPYDAFYAIFSPSQANTVDIEWNRETVDGRVRDPRHFGDPNWHCWNSDLQDIVCP